MPYHSPADTGWPTGQTYVLWQFEMEFAVLLRKETATHLLHLWHALLTAETWGELHDLMPPGEFDALHVWHHHGGPLLYRDPKTQGFTLSNDAFWVAPEDRAPNLEDNVDVIEPWMPYSIDCIPGVYDDCDYPDALHSTAEQDFPWEFVHQFGERTFSMVSGDWIQYNVRDIDEIEQVLEQHGVTLQHVQCPRMADFMW
jgi:hypothetical protein